MKEEIKVPQMGESISEASIGAILKPSGSLVKENDEVIELETEKVNQVLYAPREGVISFSVKEGDTVSIGDVIGYVDTEGKATSAPPQKPEQKEQVEQTPPPQKISEGPPKGSGERMMVDAFVEDLKGQPASSVQASAPAPKKAPSIHREDESRKKMSKMRQTIAKRLVDSLHTAAMLTTFNEVDMSAIIGLREKHRESFLEKHGVKLGFMSFFVKAVVEALKEFPAFNSYLDCDELVTRHYYDIGIAVGTEKGLLVPVVRGCDALTFAQVEKEIIQYAKKARDGQIAIADLEGGGFTITNGGVYGSMLSTPILNPPQVGILGMHNIVKRAVVIKDQIEIRPMMYLALSYDHRVADGKEAVTFLVRVKEMLEDPSRLMILGSDEHV